MATVTLAELKPDPTGPVGPNTSLKVKEISGIVPAVLVVASTDGPVELGFFSLLIEADQLQFLIKSLALK